MTLRALFLAVAAASAACAQPAEAADDPVPQRPGPSDYFRYDLQRVTQGKDGKERLGGASLVTLHGSEFGADGLYLPETMHREDLHKLMAFRFVATGTRAWKFRFVSVAETAAEATFRSEPAPAGAAEGARTIVHADWTFASRGKSDEPWSIRDGRGAATITVGDGGVVRSARVSFAYPLVKQDPKKGEAPTATDETWELTLKDARKPRYDGFYADVNAAIDRGAARLRKQQKDDGTFEPNGDWIAGTSGLALYTLLACGVPRDDPQAAKGLSWIAAQDVKRNYELALGLMAMERAYVEPGSAASEAKAGGDMPADRRAWCEKAAARLESQCTSPGSFGYPNSSRELYRIDSSNTQYAALGLRAAARLGIAVSEQTWLGLVRHFTLCREKDAPRALLVLVGEHDARASATAAPLVVREAAGFKYRAHETRTRGSMTCAGIASIAIARDELRRMKSKRLGSGDEAEIDAMIAGGWAWIDQHWAVDRNPGLDGNDWHLYWLYSLERAGLLTGVKLVNGKDWYFDGAMELLARQDEDGSWVEKGGGEKTTPSCFALLFLRRATAPATVTTGK